jgi:hypothetical protein
MSGIGNAIADAIKNAVLYGIAIVVFFFMIGIGLWIEEVMVSPLLAGATTFVIFIVAVVRVDTILSVIRGIREVLNN